VAQAPVEAEPSVQEFSFDAPDLMAEPAPVEPIITQPSVAEQIVTQQINAGPAASEITLEPVPLEQAAPVAINAPAESAHEIDISNEWEEMIEVEPAEPAAELPVQPAPEPVEEKPVVREVELEPAAPAATAGLSSQIADKVQEIHFYITQEMWEPAKSAILDLTELAPDAPEITQLIAAVSAGQSRAAAAPPRVEATPIFIDEPAPVEEAKPVVAEPPPPAPKPVVTEPVKHIVSAPPKPIVAEPSKPAAQPAAAAMHEDVLDIAPPPVARPAQPAVSASVQSTEDILSDFVLDLEQSEELADFVPKEKAGHKPPAPVPAPAIQMRSNGEMQDSEAANVLSDILSELQEETAEAAEPEEDPETHYNLGIAFKEMGLLDEAIGELQKVCHAVDRGARFSQPIQALTWLAQCLVDKGAPEAAVRWYQKALQLPGLDDGSRCAIYYDLATAYEASGDKKSALANFMEVYGSNIDFRDVASRIRALKS